MSAIRDVGDEANGPNVCRHGGLRHGGGAAGEVVMVNSKPPVAWHVQGEVELGELS